MPADLAVHGLDPDKTERVTAMVNNVLKPGNPPESIHVVPHEQYIAAQKAYGLKVPKGSGNHMFTHLPTKRVFIDASAVNPDDDKFYDWLGHEFAHLDTNSTLEDDAAREHGKYVQRVQGYRNQQKQANLVQQVDAKNFYQYLANPRGAADQAYLANPDYQSLAGK